MESLEEKIKNSVIEYEKEFANSESLKIYTEISEKFEDLVEKGLAKKRGNNLLSVTDMHIMDRVVFNVQSDI